MTATPVENSPEDVFNYVRLIHPGLLGSVTEFSDAHVVTRNWLSGKPEIWRDLDKLEAQLTFMTHRVSKEDPDVAAMFPDVIREPLVIDWNPKHRAIYDQLTGKAKDLIADDDFADANILALIQVMQMLCDAPSMILASAQNRERFDALMEEYGDLDEDFRPKGPTGSTLALRLLGGINAKMFTDHDHSKLEVWKEIITEKHPHDKIVTHSTWAGYIFPIWEYYLTEWGISYVVYAGGDSAKQKALDTFRADPSIRVFLSGDSGADSIDIPEASVGINFNGPWKWVTEKQREGRRDRVDSTFQTIYTYTLAMVDSVEDRKREIREQKRGYHDALFEGKAIETSISAKLSRAELLYMLLGGSDGVD
jgi:SNF2 family DNA or RNA helicase